MFRVEIDSSFSFSEYSAHQILPWDYILKKVYYELTILIVDFELYQKYSDEIYYNSYKEPCDTFRKYVPILHCYRLTLQDLERMNWTVVYPPEEDLE
jgi:hypothetical protein